MEWMDFCKAHRTHISIVDFTDDFLGYEKNYDSLSKFTQGKEHSPFKKK